MINLIDIFWINPSVDRLNIVCVIAPQRNVYEVDDIATNLTTNTKLYRMTNTKVTQYAHSSPIATNSADHAIVFLTKLYSSLPGELLVIDNCYCGVVA
jgi:hypothetical protein